MSMHERTTIQISKGTRLRMSALFPGQSAAQAVAMLISAYEAGTNPRGRGAAVPVLGTTESDGVERLSAGRAAASGSAVRS